MNKIRHQTLILLLALTFVFSFFMPLQAEAASVKLNKTAKTLYTGSTYQLKLNGVSKSTSVKWKSSDKKIVRVSSTGKIKGIKPGKAKVSATVNGKSYYCSVKVLRRLSVDETTFICDDMEGYAAFHIAKATDDDSITYHIADPSILQCEWGKWLEDDIDLFFIPMENGETTVTVQLNDDPNEKIDLKVTCNAGSILTLLNEYDYIAAMGRNLLDYIVYYPETLTIHSIWTSRATGSDLPFITMYYSCENSYGEISESYCTFGYGSNLNGELDQENFPYVAATSFTVDGQKQKEEHDCLTYYTSDTFPMGFFKIDEVSIPFTELIAGHYNNLGYCTIMQSGTQLYPPNR